MKRLSPPRADSKQESCLSVSLVSVHVQVGLFWTIQEHIPQFTSHKANRVTNYTYLSRM